MLPLFAELTTSMFMFPSPTILSAVTFIYAPRIINAAFRSAFGKPFPKGFPVRTAPWPAEVFIN